MSVPGIERPFVALFKGIYDKVKELRQRDDGLTDESTKKPVKHEKKISNPRKNEIDVSMDAPVQLSQQALNYKPALKEYAPHLRKLQKAIDECECPDLDGNLTKARREQLDATKNYAVDVGGGVLTLFKLQDLPQKLLARDRSQSGGGLRAEMKALIVETLKANDGIYELDHSAMAEFIIHQIVACGAVCHAAKQQNAADLKLAVAVAKNKLEHVHEQVKDKQEITKILTTWSQPTRDDNQDDQYIRDLLEALQQPKKKQLNQELSLDGSQSSDEESSDEATSSSRDDV